MFWNNFFFKFENTWMVKCIYKNWCQINSSFLFQLLAKEIRHERNVVLQCVRYIVENNYFTDQSWLPPQQKTNDDHLSGTGIRQTVVSIISLINFWSLPKELLFAIFKLSCLLPHALQFNILICFPPLN